MSCWAQASTALGKSLGVLGFLRQVTYELIPADCEHFESLACTTDVTNARTCLFFRCLFDRLPVQISTSDLLHRTWQKMSIRSELMILECSFPLTYDIEFLQSGFVFQQSWKWVPCKSLWLCSFMFWLSFCCHFSNDFRCYPLPILHFQKGKPLPSESRLFWTALVVCPIIWVFFGITSLFSLKWNWLVSHHLHWLLSLSLLSLSLSLSLSLFLLIKPSCWIRLSTFCLLKRLTNPHSEECVCVCHHLHNRTLPRFIKVFH